MDTNITDTPMDSTATNDSRLRHLLHGSCVVCSPDCPHGLRLHVELDSAGVATGSFQCDARLQGYDGLVHGGVIAALLDGAMTNCLFLHGVTGLTAELQVRFRHPVQVGLPVQVRAWLLEQDERLHRLRAELRQSGVIMATARAAFMQPRSA